jgi:hypothetical protein
MHSRLLLDPSEGALLAAPKPASLLLLHRKPGNQRRSDAFWIGRRCGMETQHNETVVDKAVNFVKDVLGIQHDAPEVVANPEYHDTEAEVAAENAMRIDPNSYRMESLEHLNAEETAARPVGDSDTERLRREVDEFPRKMSALELNAANARAEENG